MSETSFIESVLRAAEARIMTAIRVRDVAALERELATDFVHTTLGGDELDRAAFLRAVGEVPFRILTLEGESLRFRRLGEVALLSGIQRGVVELPAGGVVTSLGGFVDVFTHEGGHWLLSQAVTVDLPTPSDA